ncbi:hypothetical protein OE09_1763 [Flavobacteriaceae bacterium MAR_2010_72]|nr:hypothetical protein OE09_1763 [Flavobacteriaceae bacterium MAR_2010_72]TVZ59518.1 hypothetical protein NA63_2053 [Flavobacteriaceae bacterium MAR_2010_105]
MKRIKLLGAFALCSLISISCETEPVSTDSFITADVKSQTGNGAPSGAHYNLNIIGVSKDKTSDMDGSNGHVIFVPLERKTKIELQEGDFAVLDANGTDGVAQFQLPAPGLDPYNVSDPGDADVISDYSVFVRPLGKPGGYANITTCADLIDSDFGGLLSGKFLSALNKSCDFGGLASVEQVGQDITMRTKGKSTFTNVTAELTTIVFKVEVDEDGDLTTTDDVIIEYIRVPIFDDIIDNEYWQYDNHGLKILQVRFYPGVGTDVTEGDMDWNNE